MMSLSQRRVLIVPVDPSESENSRSDDVTTVLTVKIDARP